MRSHISSLRGLVGLAIVLLNSPLGCSSDKSLGRRGPDAAVTSTGGVVTSGTGGVTASGGSHDAAAGGVPGTGGSTSVGTGGSTSVGTGGRTSSAGTGGGATGGSGGGATGGSDAGGTGGGVCEYRKSHDLGTLPRFSFTVTLPNGSTRSCSSAGDVGNLSGEISGWVSAASATAFAVDTCAAGTGCSANVYQFAIAAPDLTLALPPGRQITVRWQISGGLSGCGQQLVASDGAPSDASAELWLAGAEGMVQPSLPLPFSVTRQELFCNPNPGKGHPCGAAFPPPDDYALLFATGGPSLSLATGASGTLALTVAAGLSQQLTVRNLRSFQTDKCDDYANWAWWATGQVGGAPPGGADGGNDGDAVGTADSAGNPQ